MTYTHILVDIGDDHVATVTLNRPEAINAFNDAMCADFARLWEELRNDDRVRVIVLRAAGDRGFCSGVDVKNRLTFPTMVWDHEDPGAILGPKQNRLWKPVIAAVHGITAGGAFYWLNEADIVICAEDTEFFDPHVSFGMTGTAEPIGMTYTMPFREVLRVALLGLDERMSARRALEIGLVSEVLPREQLWDHAHTLAAVIAKKPPIAVQGTVKALWQSLDMTRRQALDMALMYPRIANTVGEAQVDRSTFVKPSPHIR